MKIRHSSLLCLLLLGAPAAAEPPAPQPASPAAPSQQVTRRVGRVTIRVDLSQAFPGGVAVVRLGGTRLGAAWALLDGRRSPFFLDRGVPRALVPIPASTEPGETTLGIGLLARRGEQRIAVPITLRERPYAPRELFVDEDGRELLARPEALRDSRRLLAHLRTQSRAPAPGPLTAPVAGEGRGFGEPRLHTGAAAVESSTDGLGGERHRGLDFAVPPGTTVRSPGAGTVLFAGPLLLAGDTVVIDHGQGVISVLHHLSRVFVQPGDTLAAGAELGLSGDSGLAPEPLLQWRVYVHAVPVDPLVLAAVLG